MRARIREIEAAAALVTRLRRDALPALERSVEDVRRAVDTGTIDMVKAAIVDERRAGLELHLLESTRKYRAAVAELRREVGGSGL